MSALTGHGVLGHDVHRRARQLLRGVTVKPGASLFVTHSTIFGQVVSLRATNVTVCGSGLMSPLTVVGSAAVRIGDPLAGCAPNAVIGGVWVDSTVGPTVIAGNRIFRLLLCTKNDPPPTNHGAANIVFGLRAGQCLAV